MFKKTVTMNQLANKEEILDKLGSKDVLQILDKGSSIKVMLSEEHYKELLRKVKTYERRLKINA